MVTPRDTALIERRAAVSPGVPREVGPTGGSAATPGVNPSILFVTCEY